MRKLVGLGEHVGVFIGAGVVVRTSGRSALRSSPVRRGSALRDEKR